jgi:hypothetical protein
MAKMNNLLTCKECEAIALELREAYADAWISSDQESRDAWIATYKLIGGTEEDAVRAEELVSSAQISGSSQDYPSYLREVCSRSSLGTQSSLGWLDLTARRIYRTSRLRDSSGVAAVAGFVSIGVSCSFDAKRH